MKEDNSPAGEESFERAFRRALGYDPDLPPIPPGQVRPLTDPETVMRWFASQGSVEFEYDPFSPDRMRS